MIDSGRDVMNYIEVRWHDGYNHVATVTGLVSGTIEKAAAALPPARDKVRCEVVSLRFPGGELVPVGLMRFDLHVSSGPRELRYVHAVAFLGHLSVSGDAWRALLERRYGAEPEVRIREVYERVALVSKAEGSHLLAPLEIRAVDIDEVLDVPAAPGPRSGRLTEKRRRDGAFLPLLACFVGVVAGAGLALLATTTGSGGDGGAGAEVLELRTKIEALRDRYVAASNLERELVSSLSERTTELTHCRAELTGACDGLRSELDVTKNHLVVATERVAVAQTAARAATDKLTRSETTLAALTNQLDRVTTNLASTERERDAVLTGRAVAERERDAALLEVKSRIAKVNELRDALRSTCGRAGAEAAHMAWCKRIP